MKNKPKRQFLLALTAIPMLAFSIAAQTTAFDYQGSLKDGPSQANGTFDFEFLLFDTLAEPFHQVGPTLTKNGVAVASGTFSVSLDFGDQFPGANRYLEIHVRPTGGGAFTPLTPRQAILSTPYAVKSLNADNTLQLGGIAASQYVTNTNLGNNAIRNQATQQAPANFNISGNGFFGGNVGIGTTAPAHALQVNGITSLGAPGGVYGYSLDSPSPGPYPTLGFNNYWNGTAYVAGITGYGGVFQHRNGDGKLIYYNAFNPAAAGTPHSLTPKFTIDKFGNVGIGTADPLYDLHIEGDDSRIYLRATGGPNYRALIRYQTTLGDWHAGSDGSRFVIVDNGGDRFVIETGGNVGIGIASPQRLFHVNGRARIGSIPLEASTAQVCFNATGDLLQCGASSLKWKTNVSPFRSGLDVVLRLRPINFNWKESGLSDFGLGAEDVAAVAPELTFINNKGEVEGVKYDHLSVLFVNAFKEQQTQIENQQRQIHELKKIVCSVKPEADVCKER